LKIPKKRRWQHKRPSRQHARRVFETPALKPGYGPVCVEEKYEEQLRKTLITVEVLQHRPYKQVTTSPVHIFGCGYRQNSLNILT